METKVEIVELKPAQWKLYKAIRLEAVKKEPVAFRPTFREESSLTKQDWIRRVKSSEAGKTKFFFAQVNKKIIGSIGILFDEHQKAKHAATFISFYVSAKWRRRGAGRKLMEAAFAYLELDRPEIIKIKLTVNEGQTAAQSFYKKMGFKQVGCEEKDVKIGTTYFNSYLMEKFVKKV